jgi:hypothetical protein
MKEIKTSRPGKVLAYARETEGNAVISILNLSNRSVRIKPDLSDLEGDYLEPLKEEKISLPMADSLKLGPWDYMLLVK